MGPAVEKATAPFQYASSTRAGCECIGHALQFLTSIDGISAFDTISRTAMLSGLAEVDPSVLPFVRGVKFCRMSMKPFAAGPCTLPAPSSARCFRSTPTAEESPIESRRRPPWRSRIGDTKSKCNLANMACEMVRGVLFVPSQLYVSVRISFTSIGEISAKTACGTCFPAPVGI